MGFHHLPLKREAWGGAAAGRAAIGGGMIEKQQRVVAVERHNSLLHHQEKEKRRMMTLPMLPSPLGLLWKYSRRRNGVPAPAATRLQPLVSINGEKGR
jgi:hypothetical protein